MDTEAKFKNLLAAFMGLYNQINASEKRQYDFGTGTMLHPSEIHTIEAIGQNTGINVTELAKLMRVTKGAISQVIKKLEAKGMISKYFSDDNNQRVLLKLTAQGQTAFDGHNRLHQRQYDLLKKELEHLGDEQVRFLAEVMGSIERSFEQL